MKKQPESLNLERPDPPPMDEIEFPPLPGHAQDRVWRGFLEGGGGSVSPRIPLR